MGKIMDRPEIIGTRLRALRRTLKHNQKTFCEVVGISEQAWNHFEHGRRAPTVKDGVKIAKKTGVTLDWIYCGDGQGLQDKVLKKRLEDVEAEELPAEEDTEDSEEAIAATEAPAGDDEADNDALTIAEAKRRLARSFGIESSSIKIIIEA
jgi:transcriptional regulator with XRE-family HTH domain